MKTPSVSFDTPFTTIVTHPDWPTAALELNNSWLRDHCRCTDCYNVDTFQRKQNILDIADDIRPAEASISDETGELAVVWPDQHVSVYELAALRAHFGRDKAGVPMADGAAQFVQRTLWTAAEIAEAPFARVALNDLLCDDGQLRTIVASLVRYGVAFIEQVPANMQSTEMAVRRLFSVQKTLFGEMWSVSDVQAGQHADTAYTKGVLGAHNDGTYFNDAAGLQVLHCVSHKDGTGGDSLLLDGFQAVQALRERDAPTFERLCRTNVPAEYIEEGQHHRYEAPIVRRTPDGRDLEQIRFNLYDRATMSDLSPTELQQFYGDLRALSAEIQSPQNEWWFKLHPGTVVIFDNWRLLHGRSAYTGRRTLVGCYVSRTEYQSVARRMGLIK